uniref:Ipi1_N domain-containing protein n=1 Tax=Syphacia muris TaxID=451379 RepID=A0A0N5AZ50_9BILA
MKKKTTSTFSKVKVKVGKKLKKTSQTDTTISTRKLVVWIFEVFCNKSYRGLSLNDLCRQLGHYNRNVRQDAVIGVKQLLSSNPHLISSSLHLIIPSVANDGHFRSQLKSLLNLLFCVPSDAMCSHFELLLAHVLLALTHLKLPVRTFGVTIVLLLMQKYPRLCSRKSDLFSSLIDVISSSRKLLKRKLLIDVMLGILDVYFVTDKKSCGPLSIAYFSADLKNCSQVDLATNTTYFECPILSLNSTEEASPFSTWKGVLKFCTAVFPLLESLLFEENFDCDGICAEVIGKISQVGHIFFVFATLSN